jgi:HTH-type transcriptional regulator / antitoxin HipB
MSEQKLMSFRSHLNEMMKNEEFAKRFEEEKRALGLSIQIAEQREKQGISQTELAKRSGISQQQVSKLEHGLNCNMATFIKVCRALGLNMELKSI